MTQIKKMLEETRFFPIRNQIQKKLELRVKIAYLKKIICEFLESSV